MGSQLVEANKTNSGKHYRIYNIDNVYTVYLEIGEQLNPNSGAKEPIFSAVSSPKTLEEAQEYIKKL